MIMTGFLHLSESPAYLFPRKRSLRFFKENEVDLHNKE